MINKEALSDIGCQRREDILKLAIEEGARLRTRRHLARRTSVVLAIGSLLTTAAAYSVIRERAEKRLMTQHQPLPPAEVPQTSVRPASPPPRIDIVSSDSISIQDYIVRTTEPSTSVIILDDDAILEAMKEIEPRIGIVRAGGRVWLTSGELALSEIH